MKSEILIIGMPGCGKSTVGKILAERLNLNFIDILFAIASLVYVIGNRIVGIVIYAILFILVFIFVMKTDIIFKHKTSSKIKE